MKHNITRRDWLVGSSAIASGLILGGAATAQEMAQMMNVISTFSLIFSM